MDSPEASAMNAHTGSHLVPAPVGSPMHPAIGESIQRFEIIGLARDQGAESHVHLVRSPDGPKCMLKLYRSGMQPATVVKEMHLHLRRIACALLTGAWTGCAY